MLMVSHSLCLFVAGPRTSLGSGCCSPSSLSSLGACFSSSYQDLAKHIVDLSIADVRNCSTCPMAPLSDLCLVWGRGVGGRKGKERKEQGT